MATGGIQIQHLLKLNITIKHIFMWLFNSNTTLVKVKQAEDLMEDISFPDSNTTLVKVKWWQPK